MVCSSRSRNCWGIELSSRDFKTVAISVTQAKLYCIYRSENCRILEQIEKLSRYRTIEQGLQTVAISVTRGLKTVEHIKQGLENCRGIELSSRDLKTVEHIEQGLENCWGIELSSRDLKTVAISVTRALSNVAGKVIICDNNISASGGAWPKNCRADQETVEVSNYRAGTSKLSQYRSLELSYTVLTHGLHVWALALRHSPPAGDLASAYPPKPLLFTLLGVGAWRD